jgi:manganese/zinc/iron transport system permease protein
MNILALELLVIAILTAVVCVIPGVFLVLRGVSLMSDAMSHALLLGIVGIFLWVRSLTSPLLLVGAGIAGFAVVLLTEWSMHQFKLHKDAAIGLFFPFFFSCAIILISLFTRDAHLDTDMVLLGDFVFAPFMRCTFLGIDWGPQPVIALAIIVIVSVCLLLFVYQRLLVVLFDPIFAQVINAQPTALYYGMMLLTSIVAVSVFSVVGSVVVVALMITPAASAWCTARSVREMLLHAMVYSVTAAVAGYSFAAYADVSIAGSIALWSGLIFAGIVVCAPRTGMLGKLWFYGMHWLQLSSALVVQHAMPRRGIFNPQQVRIAHGWSAAWMQCVVWYGIYAKQWQKIVQNLYCVRAADLRIDECFSGGSPKRGT